MSELTFEQRHRLETEVLPAVIGDPEYAAATIVRLEAERDRLLEAGVGYTQQTVDAITKEREALRARVQKLEAEVERLRHEVKAVRALCKEAYIEGMLDAEGCPVRPHSRGT